MLHCSGNDEPEDNTRSGEAQLREASIGEATEFVQALKELGPNERAQALTLAKLKFSEDLEH